MSNLCIIPARGGSKRIPRKNIKDFLGKPIIAYSIEIALKTGLFDEVMVSTDDVEIAEIAQQYGAKVPFMRTMETSNDYATTYAVIKEVVQTYKENGKEFDAICCVYPTAILAGVEDIQKGNLLLGEADIVLPVTEFSFPPMRSFSLSETGFVEYRFPEHMNTRSQDIEPWYQDAGQWYWYDTHKLLREGDSKKMRVVKLCNLQVQDIDNMTDWKLAEMKYSLIYAEK
jgi:pseudaminic acid cytidylyltransferase